MAATKITYADKVGLIPHTTIRINQIWDDDVNEIKRAVNDNATLQDTNTNDILLNAADIILLENAAPRPHTIVQKAVNYTALVNDYIFVDATTGDITITLPTAVGNEGYEINVTKKDSTLNGVIVDTTSAQTIIGELTQTTTTQYDNMTFISDGSDWFIK